MNFKQLEAFYWLSQLGNYRQTGERLGLTQPAVSSRIRELERQLGKQLIDRATSTFRLTDPGMEVADFALRFLNLEDAMTSRLQDTRKTRFSIGMAGMASMTWGPALRDRLAGEYPNLLVDIYSGSDMQLKQFVDSGALDLAFTASGERIDGSRFTVRYDVGWVARPDVLSGQTMPMTPEALRNLPLVLYPKTSPLFSPVAKYVEERRQRPAPRHYGNSLATICEMLRLGYGASALALVGLESDLAAGRLVEIPVTEPVAPLYLACTHVNRTHQRRTDAVLALAAEAAETWCAEHPAHSAFMRMG